MRVMTFEESEQWLQSVDFVPIRNFETRTHQLQDATLEEVLDLLAEAVETYTILAPTLSTDLLEQACNELEFLTNLCRQLSNS